MGTIFFGFAISFMCLLLFAAIRMAYLDYRDHPEDLKELKFSML